MDKFFNGLKSVTMSLDKCQNFLTMENEEVGEMVKYLLEYAMYGKEPSFRNKWQGIVYNTFAFDIKHQIDACESRRINCSANKAGNGKVKSSHKSGVKPVVKTASASYDVVNGDVCAPTSSDVTCDAPDSPAVNEVINEDLTFAAFTSLYEKKDAGNYNTESAWNALSDDDKRGALRYVKENMVGKADIYRRDYPSKFLSNHPWKN